MAIWHAPISDLFGKVLFKVKGDLIERLWGRLSTPVNVSELLKTRRRGGGRRGGGEEGGMVAGAEEEGCMD